MAYADMYNNDRVLPNILGINFIQENYIEHGAIMPWKHCPHPPPMTKTIYGLFVLFVFVCGLTHRGRMTHICASKLTTIDSDNGLSPDRRKAIIRTNAGILLIGPLGTNFSEI